jgi:protein-S-isoprenylcysteine O-methyltransferase Ste14
VYFIGFVSNLFVPKSIDTGERTSIDIAILINMGLMSLFALQHSVMARQAFKKKWIRIIPEPIERSTYVLLSSIAVILLFRFWKPIPFAVWDYSGTIAGYVLMSISFLGWVILFLSTFLINHFHLFGLHQVYHYVTSKPEQSFKFSTPFLYRIVRHPLYLGFIIAFWMTPLMTLGHLLFSITMTLYILIGIYHEEKDLIKTFGNDYLQYRKKTPKILPFSK